MPISHRWLYAAAVLVLAATLTSCGEPALDAFYDAGGPITGRRPGLVDSGSRPGDVVSSRPARFTVDPFTLAPVAGVESQQLLYRSTTGRGEPVVVSGTVLVPTTPWTGAGSRPLVSYGVGTRGVGDQCAPSKSLSGGLDYESGIFQEALGRGWAIAVSDMVGLGTAGTHTYEVGRDQGTALIDIARAAERLDGTGLDASTPVAFWGYSQGGTSAGWAAQLAASYAPDLNVVAVAAGGVPADLRAVAVNLDGNPFFSLLTLAALGYDAAYPGLDLDRYLNDAGRRTFAANRNFCIVGIDGIQTFGSLAGHHMSDYLGSTNPLTTPEWIAALDENRLGGAAPAAPVLLLHGLVDQVIPRAQAVTLLREWCAAGATVAWTDLPTEHALGIVLSVQPALDFLSARFAGVPATSSCGEVWP